MKFSSQFIRSSSASGERRTANLILLFVFCLLPFDFSPQRLAIIDLQGDERGEMTALLRQLAQGEPAQEDKSQSFELVDEGLTRVAARGAGYAGSLNMSLDEARSLGQSLGCNYYILGKVLLTRRLAADKQSYYEALAGIFIVETRTGRLIKFVFERARGESEEESRQKLKEMIRSGWLQFAQALISAGKLQAEEIERVPQTSLPVIELIDDRPEGKGIDPPAFYQRLKPVYTEQAEQAGISATVEIEAVFGEEGRVGDVKIIRWAGFGLDESSIETLRLIKFKPAERDGKRLTIRGHVRYNFKRPVPQAAKPQAQSREEIERLKESLREILKSGQKPK